MKITTFDFTVSVEIFRLSEETLSKPHLLEDTFPKRVRTKENDQLPYFDVDEKLFREWCLPYIRHNQSPKEGQIDSFKKEHLIHLTQAIGLDSLAKLLKAQTPPVERKTFRITYTVADCGFSNTRPYVSYFNGIKYDLHYVSGKGDADIAIDCPDKGCQARLEGLTPDQVRNHYLSSPHNGTITPQDSVIYRTDSKNFLIECRMKDFEGPQSANS